jgi:hypothetical protein
MRDLERRPLSAEENAGAAVRDRRYSAIFSHLQILNGQSDQNHQ